jgi:hypothetical protein
VAEIERSCELESSQSERPSIGYSKSRRREVPSSESAIGSYRHFNALCIEGWKTEGLVSSIARS